MADLRTSFVILEDVSTQAGVPLHKAVEGDAAAGKNAHPSLVAKDGSGNLVYLKIDSSGALAVTTEGSKVCKSARGTATGSATFVDVATITLTNGATYQDLDWVVSCFRDAVYEVVYVEDVGGLDTETLLADVLCGAGDFTDSGQLKCQSFTVPGSGVNELRLRAKNLNALSDFRGTITIGELT